MRMVGDKFPSFDLQAVNEDNEMCSVDDWSLSGWSVIYFYPKDFTFICPTEIAAMDILLDEADDVIGISSDKQSFNTIMSKLIYSTSVKF